MTYLYESYLRLFIDNSNEKITDEKIPWCPTNIGQTGANSSLDKYIETQEKRILVLVKAERIFNMKTIEEEITKYNVERIRGYHIERLYNSFNQIIPSSVEVERVFSVCGYIYSKRRKRLSSSMMNMIIFLRYYLRNY